MNFKKLLLGIFVAFLLVNTAIQIYPAVQLPTNTLYFFVVAGIVSLLVYLTDNTLKFLTLKPNFLMRLLFSTLLAYLGFMVSRYLSNNLIIEAIDIPSIDLSLVITKPFKVTQNLSLLIECAIIGLLNSIYYELSHD
jgi:hypothetical protein